MYIEIMFKNLKLLSTDYFLKIYSIQVNMGQKNGKGIFSRKTDNIPCIVPDINLVFIFCQK